MDLKNGFNFAYVYRKNGNHYPADDIYQPAKKQAIQVPFRYYCDNLIFKK
jgi:hypothetical protein